MIGRLTTNGWIEWWLLLAIVFGLGLGALVLTASETTQPAPVEPLEVTINGATECAPGWRRMSLDHGWVVHYPARGVHIPSWIDEDRLRAAFTDPSGRVVEDALALAVGVLPTSPRIVCRWAPLVMTGEPAD